MARMAASSVWRCFTIHDGEHAPAPGHDVHLDHRKLAPAGNDSPAFQDQQQGGELLGPSPAALCAGAARAKAGVGPLQPSAFRAIARA